MVPCLLSDMYRPHACWLFSVLSQQRETEDVATRKLIAQSKADQEKWLAAISLALNQVGAGAQALMRDHLKEVVGAVVCIALGIYASREAVTLIRSEIQRRLSQPKLVRETSRVGLVSSLWQGLLSLCKRGGAPDGFADVVLEPTLDKALRVLAVSSRYGTGYGYWFGYGYGLSRRMDCFG